MEVPNEEWARASGPAEVPASNAASGQSAAADPGASVSSDREARDASRSVDNGTVTGTADRIDTFWFNPGDADGVTVANFSTGDKLVFSGFGTAEQGATFTQIDTTNQWILHSGLDGHEEIITVGNDHVFQPDEIVFFHHWDYYIA